MQDVETAPNWRNDRIAWLIALVAGVVHLLLAGRYDLFRDELYFIVCGQHPAFGYADQPALVPLVAAGLYTIGHSAWWVRLPSVIAAAGLVFVTVRFVRTTGGGNRAAVLAGLAAAIAPVLMGLTAILSTSSFDPVAFTAIALLLIKGGRGDDRALLLAGVIAGMILEVKFSLALWAAGLAVGILLTEQRRLLTRPAFWFGAAIAAGIAAPALIWQALSGFPFVALSAAADGKNVDVSLLSFIGNQLFIMNPLLAPVWIAGLIAPFARSRFAELRFLTIAYLVTFAIIRFGHGKDYYLAALYPAFIAIGASWLGEIALTGWKRWTAVIWATGVIGISALASPLALPILPPESLEKYMVATGLAPQQQEKSFAGTILPQVFADQLGWRTFAGQVSAGWAGVPADIRPQTAILVDNYGEAASLDLYTRGLPPVLSGHNQYGLWGLRGQQPQHVLVITDEPEQLSQVCGNVQVLGTTAARFAMAYENGKAIALCRDLKQPLAALWPEIIHFD